MNQPRQPRGVPVGGEYATQSRDENPDLVPDRRGTLLTLDYETLPWTPNFDIEALSRRQRDKLPRTYSPAIPVELAEADFDIPLDLQADVEDATIAISDLDTYVTLASGGEQLVPMQIVLLRSESSASSQIENLTVGTRQLALAELGAAASHNGVLVAGNVDAMLTALRLSDRLDTDSILKMHGALMGESRPDLAGHWRTTPVWIGSSGISPEGAAFIPPTPQRVPEAMADLQTFMQRNDLPVLTQAAIAHAQFETIHPFGDGNGRTGRALVHAMLRNKGRTRNLTIPISGGLLTDTDAYFDALTAYRDGDPKPIVVQFARASRIAAVQGRKLTDDLIGLRVELRERIGSRAGSAGERLVTVLVGQPAVSAEYVQTKLGVSEPAARRAIDQAVTAGILTEAFDRKRNRVWVANDVIAVLDSYAEVVGRRG